MPAVNPDMPQAAKRALEMTPAGFSGPGGLIELLGALFHCMVGPPMAYIEIPLDWDQGSVARAVRFTYVTLGYTTECTDLTYDKAEATLARALWADFKQAYLVAAGHGCQPLLFWRLEPIREHDRSTERLKVRCRVAIPGVDLTKSGAYAAEGTGLRFVPEVLPSAPEQQEGLAHGQT